MSMVGMNGSEIETKKLNTNAQNRKTIPGIQKDLGILPVRFAAWEM